MKLPPNNAFESESPGTFKWAENYFTSLHKPKKSDGTTFRKDGKKNLPTGEDFIFQTDNVMAFLDFLPVAKGHSLLVTKHLYSTIMDMPPKIAADFMSQL